MATLIDYYGEEHSSSNSYFTIYSNYFNSCGQSFTCSINATLDSCKFYLKTNGSPNGNAIAKLYAHSGVYGTSSIPTGVALATSNSFDVSTLNSSYQLITFNFSGAERIKLNSLTYYIITIEYNDGDSSNAVLLAIEGGGSASGNLCHYYYPTTTWSSTSSSDAIFYVYGDLAPATITGLSTIQGVSTITL